MSDLSNCPPDSSSVPDWGPTPPNFQNDIPVPPIDQKVVTNRPTEPIESELPGFLAGSRSLIAAYSRSLRNCDQAVRDEFKNIKIWTDEGHEKDVPIIWGPQEKAVAYALSEAISKTEVRIDRIKLPMLALSGGDISFAPERFTYHQNIRWLKDGKGNFAYGSEKRYGDTVYGRSRGLPVDKGYTLYAWTRYTEEMNQIVEQILLKFCPIITINVDGIYWEVVLKLDGVSNTISPDIGDAAIRILKFEFNFHAETYISRGFIRGKTVFDIYTDVGIGDNLDQPTNSETLHTGASDQELDDLYQEGRP